MIGMLQGQIIKLKTNCLLMTALKLEFASIFAKMVIWKKTYLPSSYIQ